MASLILQFEDKVLKEYGAGLMVTIGRLPDNTIIIDNPAVSGHHACIFRDGDQFVVEDLQSTNGTFVNDKRVTRQILKHGDVVLLGKHKLMFDQQKAAAAESAEPEIAVASQGDTVFLDTRQHRALLNRLADAEAHAGRSAGGTSTLPAKVGTLRAIEGEANGVEYRLEGRTTLIGKAPGCSVRLRGWFKPNVAVAITRNPVGYVATLLGGTTLINNRPLRERHELKDGDVLEVSGLMLEFRLTSSSPGQQMSLPGVTAISPPQ